MAEITFIGFYPTNLFWAGAKPDLDDVQTTMKHSAPGAAYKLNQLMSEEVFIADSAHYTLKVSKDTMFLLHLKDVTEDVKEVIRTGKKPDMKNFALHWSKYLDCLNAIYLLFESQFIKQSLESHDMLLDISEIAVKDVYIGKFVDGKLREAQYSMNSNANLVDARHIRPGDEQPLAKRRFTLSQEVPEDVFPAVNEDFSKAYQDFRYIRILSAMTKSLGEYKAANYATSIILSWFAIESYLNIRWAELLESKNYSKKIAGKTIKRIDKDRLDILKGRDYPVSVISNMLELFDIIDNDLLREIDKVRKYRNKIVHQDEKALFEPRQCITALEVTKSIINDAIGVDVSFDTGYYIPSFIL